MKLVIDTNRLVAALIKSSFTREIILSDKFKLYSPDFILTEINNNLDFLIEKAKLNLKDFKEILIILLNHINLVPFEDFKNKYLEALEIMKNIDPDDTPFLALGLSLKVDGIWTEDKDFDKQKILKVYSTKDLLEIIKNL